MKEKLIQKAQELRQHGFTTGEIADELNVSMDTARWLTLQKPTEEKTDAPTDFAINWKSIGGNSARLRYVSSALSDMTLNHGEAEVVCGIAVSGVPFATMMADVLEDMTGLETSLAIFHPNKHRKDNDETDDEGTISTNFGTVEGKKVVIVANLKPAKLCGVESFGMLLAGDREDGSVCVNFIDDSVPVGTRLH